MKNLLYFLFITLFFACSNAEPKTPEEAQVATPAPAVAATPAQVLYPSIPFEDLKYLYDNCDFIDYVYYDLPISMSLSEKPSIQNTFVQVSQQPASVHPSCGKSGIARITYQIKGDIVAESEMFFTDNCKYFVFYEDGKPKYSNLITPQGIEYLENLFKSISTQ